MIPKSSFRENYWKARASEWKYLLFKSAILRSIREILSLFGESMPFENNVGFVLFLQGGAWNENFKTNTKVLSKTKNYTEETHIWISSMKCTWTGNGHLPGPQRLPGTTHSWTLAAVKKNSFHGGSPESSVRVPRCLSQQSAFKEIGLWIGSMS